MPLRGGEALDRSEVAVRAGLAHGDDVARRSQHVDLEVRDPVLVGMDARVREHDEDVGAVRLYLWSRVAAVTAGREHLDGVRVESDPDRAEDLFARRVDEVGPHGRHAPRLTYRAGPTLPSGLRRGRGQRRVALLAQEPLRVERRHAARAGCGDRLPVGVILDVSCGEDAGHIRRGRPRRVTR